MGCISYVGERDYITGKFRVVAISQELNKELKEELEEFCLELISKNTGPAIAINSLSNGKYIIEMAKRIEEPNLTVHHIVHGLIVSRKEVEIITEKYIAEGRAEDLFFAEKVDLECPEKWNIPEISGELKGDTMKSFLNAMNYEELLRLSFALYELGKREYKIRLMVEEEKKPVVFAALFRLAVISGAVGLSFLMNGETTCDSPHLLLTDQIDFMDVQKYERLTLEELVQKYGRTRSILEDQDEEMRQIDNLVDYCYEYLTNGKISDRDIYERTSRLLNQERKLYEQFVIRLKNMLGWAEYDRLDVERFMKLVYLAFKKVEEPVRVQESELEAAGPYDYCRMINFLREKSNRKDKEFKKLLNCMLQIQIECCLGANQAVTIRQSVATLLKRCTFGEFDE